MNVKQLETAIQYEIWLVTKNEETRLTVGLVQFEPADELGEYKLVQNGKLLKVALKEKHHQNDLNFHLRRGCARLSQILQTAKDGSALLKVNFFNGPLIELGELEVGIDERIESTARRVGLRFKATEELTALLHQKTTIGLNTQADQDYFIIIAGSAAAEDFEWEDQEDKPKPLLCFSLQGEEFRMPVERRQLEPYHEIFFATRFINQPNKQANAPLLLARGKLQFADYTKTGRIRTLAAGSMSRLLQEKGSYLKQWDQYGAVEGELLLNRARLIGKLQYNNLELTGRGVKFFFPQPLPKELAEDDELEITAQEPIYIEKMDLTWEQYSDYLEEEFKARQRAAKPKVNKHTEDDAGDNGTLANQEASFAKIVQIEANSLILDIPGPPGPGKFLVLSISGEKIQIERRMRARRLILEGRSANPLLGLLIEEGGEIPKIQRVTRLKPLTPFVKQKIFKHNPTPVQVQAIDLALNTPDIALIQGPPGTGKTTVITAILERLNEEHDKTRSIRGEILVSGFQHDAVENIVARLSVNALPAVKFGRRSGERDLSDDTPGQKLEAWCKGIAEQIRSKNPRISQTEDQRALAELFNLYAISPSLRNSINLLDRILQVPRNILTPELVEKTTLLLELLKSEAELAQFCDQASLRAIRALRVSEAGFLDDGKERAMDFMERFENLLTEEEQQVLRLAILWREGRSLAFLPELREIKGRLLELFTPRPQYNVEKPREDILGLIAQVSRQLDQRRNSQNQVDVILADFLHELEDNPDGVREAIEDYNFVFAATTQQAEGVAIRRAKTREKDEFIRYDTVVIDEAARTSPRDLLIPMAQAEKRIILVGDHRQLPHLINEEVAKLLESGGDQEGQLVNPDFVNKSMFEYLFRRLKKLEQDDGIRRTITLDAQYRMHPRLGQFVSDEFYQKYREGYGSPLPEALFRHNLADTNRSFAVWLNVPPASGGEKKRGTSRIRSAEAKAIAKRLKLWLDSPEGKELSFGVISFYKAQINEIFEELSHSQYGITEKTSGGSWEIASDYKFLKKEEQGKLRIEERLRIGTVDAFQGMEFDVVFLSMVRSTSAKELLEQTGKINDEEQLKRKIFGHLLSENRLCVSMSRQKRLLVVAGDSSLIQTELAKKAVPALGRYYQLCAREGVIL